MAKGYVIAQVNVTDPETYKTYVGLVGPTIEAFGGQFLVRGGKSQSYEGTPPGTRNIIIEFPSLDAAEKWYHSDVYKEAKTIRMSASTSVQTIVEGI